MTEAWHFPSASFLYMVTHVHFPAQFLEFLWWDNSMNGSLSQPAESGESPGTEMSLNLLSTGRRCTVCNCDLRGVRVRLVYCIVINGTFSVTRSRQLQGASGREWLVLSNRRNKADDGFSSRPKGGTQMTQYCFAVLVNGTTINCRLRLVLNHL